MLDGTAQVNNAPLVYTVKRAAELVDVSPRTVYNWIKEKHIRAVKLPGGDFRIRPADLEAFIASCIEPVPEATVTSAADLAHQTQADAGRRGVRPDPLARGRASAMKLR